MHLRLLNWWSKVVFPSPRKQTTSSCPFPRGRKPETIVPNFAQRFDLE